MPPGRVKPSGQTPYKGHVWDSPSYGTSCYLSKANGPTVGKSEFDIPANLYEPAFRHANAHGVLVAFRIPDSPTPVPVEVISRLHPEEAERARTLQGYRQVQFVGGRLAARAARKTVGAPPGALLSDERGAPLAPKGWACSISHKNDVAIAMFARSRLGSVGVDIEAYGPKRMRIASRVLRPEELAEIAPLPEDRRWIATLIRFSIKESIYKALAPQLKRYIGFHEASVRPDLNGTADVQLFLDPAAGPFHVDARYEFLHQKVLTSVRVRRA